MRSAGLIPEIPEGVDWWDPVADNAVRPDLDAVLVNGVRVVGGKPSPAAAESPRRRTGHLLRG